jgi:hypothetical protein
MAHSQEAFTPKKPPLKKLPRVEVIMVMQRY